MSPAPRAIERQRRARVPRRLELGADERAALRAAGLRLVDLAHLDARQMADLTAIPEARCEELGAALRFQTLASVGPETAHDLVLLGFRELEELRDADPSRLYQRLCAAAGRPLDPCVEDSLRCAIAQVTFPDLRGDSLRWWTWSEQRGQHGVSRPATASRRRRMPR